MKKKRSGLGQGDSGKRHLFVPFAKEAPGVTKIRSSGMSRAALKDLDPSKADVMSPEYWEKMVKHFSPDMRKEFAPMLQQVLQNVPTEARWAEIDAAIQVLGDHRDEYDKLRKDADKWLQQSDKLFAEKAFEDMRFHAADLQRAFDAVGYPSTDKMDKKGAEFIAKSVNFLVNDGQRKALAQRLFLLLPDYVNAGRYMDGWMIQHSADIMLEPSSDVIGGFLVAMFMHGLKKWEMEREREQETLFKKLGISSEEIQKMGIEGFERWLESIKDNPEKCDAMQKCLAQHPELADMAEAHCLASETEALELLKREEAEILFLTTSEVRPWLAALEARLKDAPEDFVSLARGHDSEAFTQAIEALLFNLSSEMVKAIFTAKRLQQLKAQLNGLKRSFEAEDDQIGIDQVEGAHTALHVQTVEGNNHFLASLCYASLHREMKALPA